MPWVKRGRSRLLDRATLEAPDVPEWLKRPYRAIHLEEKEHGSFPAEALARLAESTSLFDKHSRAGEDGPNDR